MQKVISATCNLPDNWVSMYNTGETRPRKQYSSGECSCTFDTITTGQGKICHGSCCLHIHAVVSIEWLLTLSSVGSWNFSIVDNYESLSSDLKPRRKLWIVARLVKELVKSYCCSCEWSSKSSFCCSSS
jgi:hypothetical protein